VALKKAFTIYNNEQKILNKKLNKMKNSNLILGLFIIILSACNNNSQNAKHPDGSALKQDTAGKSTNELTVSVEPKKSIMKGFKSNIEKDVLKNENYREVIYTGKHLQLVLMSLKPGEEIGSETHVNSDQFFRFESGKGKCIINENEYNVESGDVIIVPAGSKHNVINTDAVKELKMYTIYAIPQHKDGIIRATKKDAENNATKFDGETTE
jgi:mannose-6-phosphate isomerase-like protein (cupin superfamily)